MLKIVTFNIEGIKGNSPYLQELATNNTIICLQEHWLHEHENDILKKIIPNHDYHISCHDDDEIDLELYKRRGKVVC